MNVLLIALGSLLMALGLMMAANRSGYVYFVVGPRSVLVVAGVAAGGSQIRFAMAEALARISPNVSGPVKPGRVMLYIAGPTERARPTET
jgi:hypothetical protein